MRTDAPLRTGVGAILGRALMAGRLSFTAAPKATIALVGLAVAEGLLPAAGAWSLKLLLDELARGTAAAPDRILLSAAAVGLAGLLLGVHSNLDRYAEATMRRALRLAVQDGLYRRVNALTGLTPFENHAFLSQLRLAEQAGERAPEEVIGGALTLLRNAVLAAAFVAALIVVWPPVVGLLLFAAVPAVSMQTRLGRRRARLSEGLTPLLRRQIFFQTLLTDARAAKEIRLFGLGDHLHGRMMSDLRTAHGAEAALDRRSLRAEATLQLVAAGSTVVATVIAAHQAWHGRLSVGDVSVFLAAVGGIHAAIGAAASALAAAYEGLLLLGHYERLVEAPAAAQRAPDRSASQLRSGIELRGVWFRHDAAWVLRDINLTISCGATVGLVGANGAGKSTVVKLLCRMYEPDRGVILWDGHDIRSLDPQSLRARIGVVFQDYMAYDFSAAENIGLGRLEALGDLDAIRAAARAAGVDADLLALDSGYQTLLSRTFAADDATTAASMLSGGQWQRVALARAFLRHDADLMILDEPTSGLDAQAEHDIRRSLSERRADGTNLLISHRLSTMRECDLIYVLDHGRVVESGKHDDLVDTSGLYARLFRLQAAGYLRERSGTGR